MTDKQIDKITKQIFTKGSTKLTLKTGQHLMVLIKKLEHVTVLKLQKLGELKLAIQHEVYRNSGTKLDL